MASRIIFVIGFFLVLALVMWGRSCKLERKLDQVTGAYLLKDSAYVAAQQEAKRWRTKDSLSVLQINSMAVSERALRDYNKGLEKRLKAAKINPKSIERQTEVATTTAGTVKVRIDTVFLPRGDSSGAVDTAATFTYSDKWLDLEGKIEPPDSLSVDYRIRDSLGLYWHEKRDGIFKPKKLRLTAFSLNPKTTVTGIRDYEIATKPQRFSIVVGGGYGVTLPALKPGPFIGVVAGYKLY